MTTTAEQALRQAADMFHEVGMAIAADDLLADRRNAKMDAKLRENLRSPDQLLKIAADGLDLCVRAGLERCADMFRAISRSLLPTATSDVGEVLRANRARIREVSADGFELCVRELARLGATDVTIHECGERDMEEHW